MKKTFLAMTAILFGYSVFAQNTNQLLSNYINIKMHLLIVILNPLQKRLLYYIRISLRRIHLHRIKI